MFFLADLAIMLVAARLLGEVAGRFQLPPLLGYMFAGIILGPLLGIVEISNINNFAQIGLILLLFVAGFKEVDVEQFLSSKRIGTVMGILGGLIPGILAFYLGQTFNYGINTSLFLGVAVAATSISISLGTFISLGKLNTKVGRAVLSASIVDDVFGLILLAIISSMAAVGGFPGLMQWAEIIGGLLAFALVFVIGGWIVPKLLNAITSFRTEEVRFSIIFVLIVLIAYFAQLVGLSTVLGAFVAGIILSRSTQLHTKSFSDDLEVVSASIFIPLFFAWVGLSLQLVSFDITFILFLTAFAVLGKLIAAMIAGAIEKFTFAESATLGIGMIPRGEVALIILTLGQELGVVPPEIFSSVFILMLITTIATPVTLSWYMKGKKLTV
ncbi:MAG: cation:proton antiporter [Candidatus Diapherotrites archaeon]|nr:cation:proton antiporter [Candidatus Diapherotrites archaeon]